MKKRSIYFMLSGAVALAGIFGLSGCSSNDEMAVDNPNYNPETGEVNVDFVFNVSTANEPTTRMSAANTQATLTEPFRGITDAYLGTFKLGADGKYLTDAETAADKLHALGPVAAPASLNQNPDATGDHTKSHRVLQLSLESGTNTMLFWGKAPKTGTDMEQGKITMDIKEKPSETTISMCRIVPQTAYADRPNYYQGSLAQYQNLIASIMTYIIGSEVPAAEYSFNNVAKNVGKMAWKDYVTVTGDAASGYTLGTPTKDPADASEALSLLSQRLNYTFKQLNTIHSGELRAGYGLAVSNMITDLMGNINGIVSATPLNVEEVVAQAVAAEIKTRVEKFFTENNNEYTWKSTNDVKAAATFVLDNDKNLVLNDYNLQNFPADGFNLPLGSTILELDIKTATAPATGYDYTYHYSGTVETYAMGNGSNAFDPKNYMFPAELCYFGNSSIRVTDETKVVGDYPDGVAEWNNESNWSGWTANKHVTSSTRSVAMKDNINYGTALLKSYVRYGAQTLKDNNHKLQDEWSNHLVNEPDNTIDVTSRDDHFVLTGILVGGQNPEVGWNYIAKASNEGFGAMIYDKAKSTVGDTEVDYIQIPKATAAAGGNQTVPMYTLLWDNWNKDLIGQTQNAVYVAVEFKNNSKDFYGQNNLIRNGSTFYIIGKLDPDKRPANLTEITDAAYIADKSLGITWPTKYALPPYDADGNTIKQRRVFMQDFMTIATFVIGENSLQKALVAVPDLRSGQIALGLSVDLEWQTGINFGEIILGQ